MFNFIIFQKNENAQMQNQFQALTVAIILLFCSSPVLAEDASPIFAVRIFGTAAKYAPPPWSDPHSPLDSSEMYRNERETSNNTRAFILEYIPKGESFDSWSELYAIQGEFPLQGDVQAYRDGHISIYANACSNISWLKSRTVPLDQELFVVFCSNYIEQPQTGEISIVNMKMVGETLVKNYYNRRVPAYEITDSGEKIPLEMHEIIGLIELIGNFELISVY